MPERRLVVRLAVKSGATVKSKKDSQVDAESVEQQDERAAREILATRIGGYSGTVLPGGKKIK